MTNELILTPRPADEPIPAARLADDRSPAARLADDRFPAPRAWRVLLSLPAAAVFYVVALMMTFAFLAVAAALTGHRTGPDGLPVFGPLPDLVVTLLMVALMLPAVVLAQRWVQGRPLGTLSSVTGRLRWSPFMLCVPAAAVSTGLGLAGAMALTTGRGGDDGGAWVGWGPFALSVLIMLAFVPLQAAAEEYAFRGFLMQAFGALLRRPWPAILIQAALFAAMHGWGTPWGFADLVVFGACAGWLTVRTGGLEAAIALHVVNNVAAFVLSAAFGLLTVDETAADAPWQLVLADVVAVLLYTAVVAKLTKPGPTS
jgi:membrane protease YdiL (CAAX protease family)